ncbi:hypothetical protein GQ457_07G006800 [Hibiscus cannabinus]
MRALRDKDQYQRLKSTVMHLQVAIVPLFGLFGPFEVSGGDVEAKGKDGEEAVALEAKFSLDDIKEAIWNCDDQKAPGPDGFSLCFYKKFWDSIKFDLLEVFNVFYKSARLPKKSKFILHSSYSKTPCVRQIVNTVATGIVDVIATDVNAFDLIWGVLTECGVGCDEDSSAMVTGHIASDDYNKSDLSLEIEKDLLNELEEKCGCKVGELPFTYLGIPLGADPRRATTWDPIIERFRLKLSGWKSQSTLEEVIKFKYGETDGHWISNNNESRNISQIWKWITRNLYGSDVDHFWKDLWCGVAPLRVYFPRLYRLVKAKGQTIAAVVGVGDFSNIVWDSVFSRKLLERELKFLSSVNECLATKNLEYNSSDKIIWMQDKVGQFSVATVTKLLLNADVDIPSFNFDLIWKLKGSKRPRTSLLLAGSLQNFGLNSILESVVLDWFLPKSGSLKFNVDKACNSRAAGCGGVLRNCLGDVKTLFSRPVECQGADFVELMVVRTALVIFTEAFRIGRDHLIVESDSKVVLHWIANPTTRPWR